MSDFSIASFNVKNLIGPDQEFDRFQSYSSQEYAWKTDWLAEQVQTMDADILCFQETFDETALLDVIGMADAEGIAANAGIVRNASKRYRRKALFRNVAYRPYKDAALAIAANVREGAPKQRGPGVAILSRFDFVGDPEYIQDLARPVDFNFGPMGPDGGGHFRLTRLSRPILKVRVPVGKHVITVFNCQLTSPLGEFVQPDGAEFAPEQDLLNYDPVGRALAELRATLRRLAEAWVLRRAVLVDLQAGHPVMVVGDFNDGDHAQSSEIVCGERPFKNYTWMPRHDAKTSDERYSTAEDAQIRESINAVRLHSAKREFVRKSARDRVMSSAFSGANDSIDQIYMSRHFLEGAEESIGQMDHLSVLNDHLTDGCHPEAPYNKLASDHGQIIAHMRLKD